MNVLRRLAVRLRCAERLWRHVRGGTALRSRVDAAMSKHVTDAEVGNTNEPLQVEKSKVGRSEGGMWATRVGGWWWWRA